MQKNTQVFAGIDVGSSFVRVVIGFANEEGGFSIAGVGVAPCQGVRKGVVVHPEEVSEAINAAVEEAERQAGVNVSRATVLINGAQVGSQSSRGVVAISGTGRSISEEDRMRVEEAATVIQMPANREIIQVFAKNYYIDGDEATKDPIGMHGVRLEVEAHILSASTPSLKGLDFALERSGIRINSHVVAGLAAAEAVLDRRQKECGTAIVDIGAATTNIAILEDGEIEHIAVIPVGGQNITNDLAIGLKTDLDIAEKVKKSFTGLGSLPSYECKIEHNGQKIVFDGPTIQMIIEARLEEMMELIDKEFAKVKKSKKLPGGAVFVGGTASLKGLCDYAKEKLELPAITGSIKGLSGLLDSTKDPSMATPVGIMMLDSFFSSGHHTQDADRGWFSQVNPFARSKRLHKKRGQ